MLTSLICSFALQQPLNTLTQEEKDDGWVLLFDGKTTNGWRNFLSETIGDGWQVKDGILTITNPYAAGDIITKKKYQWFEMKIDFKLGEGENSGVLFHVTEDADRVWKTGPEIQIYDHQGKENQQQTGWLYQIQSSKVDSTNPVGQWNTLEFRIAKNKCWTKINGKLYYEYVLHDEDFWAKVKKSKFSAYPTFAKSDKGHIAIQGDHGHVSFRNIKLKELK